MSTDAQWAVVHDLYSSVASLNADERARYLDEHCTDPAIRKRVDEMFAEHATATIGISASGEQVAAGSMLGHYRVGRRLGAGGMGLVYKAVDEKLKRSVAIKVIPEHRADEESRRRFIREAQAASALNHPNIVTVYEVGSEGDTEYIAFEYVEGRTLREVIGKTGLEARRAMRYAAQIAGALAAAHQAGIVHRDLKPGNVMITARDVVKVLDFGLAKQSAAVASTGTQTSLTERGQVVGTVVYMSPEQAEGLAVDARSDIFSFGSLLYEMLTARRAFERQSGIGTLAAILNEEPSPLEQLAPAAPRGLRRLVTKCLQKRPDDRWQNMHDVKLALEDLLDEASSPQLAAASPQRASGTKPLWVALGLAGALAALGLAAALLFVHPATPPGPEAAYRMLTTVNGLSDYPAISRDGKFVAYASDRGGQDNLDIWLQQVGGQDAIRLTNDPADKSDPAFSPDGAKIAFRSEKDGGGIYVVPALGGDAVLLAPAGRNPRFSPDGHYVAYWTGRGEGSEVAGSGQAFIVESGGGPPRAVHPEMPIAKYPVWSPRGDQLLALGVKGGSERDWWVLPIENGAPVKTGVLADMNRTRFERSFRAEQEPIDWTDDGVLFAARLGDSVNLWETKLTGTGERSAALHRRTSGPGAQVHASRALTADFERTAFSDDLINYDIWSMPVDQHGAATAAMKRVTDTVGTEWAPSLDGNGRYVAYVTAASSDYSVRLKDLNMGRDRFLYSTTKGIANARISGDGRIVLVAAPASDILSISTVDGEMKTACSHCGAVTGASFDGRYAVYEPVKDEDLMLVDTVTQQKYDLAVRPGSETLLTGGQLSSDGKWAAFYAVRYLTRTTQVFIVPVNRSRPASTSEWIAITDGSTFAQDPSWGPGDNVLYFVSERDGFRCYWAQELDPKTKKPIHEPFALQHFHSARRTLRGTSSGGYRVAPSYGGGRVAFSFGDITGNIWLQEKRRGK